MPGWHAATQQWVDDGKLVVLGVVQEQHAERTRLYKQWRQLQWPILQDAFNILNIKAVPLAIAIDENGIVRSHRANPRFLETWLDEKPADPGTGDKPKQLGRSIADVDDMASAKPDIAALIQVHEKQIGESDGVKKNPRTHFELGVAYRMRYDRAGHPDDFQRAIDYWSSALKLDPNQYIYRRRIQQYGARLGKPYPFYDWVSLAQQEIKQRGETPVELTVPLSGAEIAKPIRSFTAASESETNPDPNAKIHQDADNLVQANVVVVPKKIRPGSATRIHVLLTPSDKAKWNNEAEPTRLWINSTEHANISHQQVESEMPEAAESNEFRQFEFEIRVDPGATDKVTVPAYALYWVCRNDNGQCVYLRKNIDIELEVESR